MKGLKITLGVFHACCIVLICLMTAIALPTFNLSFYRYEYAKNNVAAHIGIQEDALMDVTDHLLRYTRGYEDNLDVTAEVQGVSRPFFNDKEKAHMVDVRGLFALGFWLRNGALIGFILSAAFMARIKMNPGKTNLWTIGVLLGATGVLVLLCAMNFDRAFTMFHQLFFTNDLWMLNPDTDLLLNMVPLPFFMDIAALVAGLFVAMLAAVAGLSFWAIKRYPAQGGKP